MRAFQGEGCVVGGEGLGWVRVASRGLGGVVE